MIVLRPYQEALYGDIIGSIRKGESRVLVQAETGFGKSILIGHLANNLKGRTLILTHRIELLNQNSEWIEDLGKLTAKVRKVEELKKSKNVIAMTQTAQARFSKYGADYLGDFDNVLVDETHVDYFKKVYNMLNPSLVIGFTATPIIYKNETKKIEGVEFTRKLSLADDFDVLHQGIGVEELIGLGYLTEDKYVELQPPNLDALVKSSSNPDGYTSNSLTEVFGSRASMGKVFDAYKLHEGKKTIIFSPTTAVNKRLYEKFLSDGYQNVKMYDSVNKVNGETRDDIVNWFKETQGAVLLNVGVFTTGFDVPDIEVIIYNKATLSLSLWLQSCGRGGRISEGKDSFLIMDLGLNIQRHGFWSDNRDWSKYFKKDNWKKKTATDTIVVWECPTCYAYNPRGTLYSVELDTIICSECKTPKPKSKDKTKNIEGELVEVEKKPRVPSASQIVAYAERNGNDANLAFRLLEKQTLSLFEKHVDKEMYKANESRFKNRIKEIYRPVYFSIIRNKKLKGANKRLSTQIEKILTKLNKYYGEA